MNGGQAFGHLAVQERLAVRRIPKIHLEVVPGAVLEHAHIPRAGNRVRKLPDDVEALFVRKSLAVGLDDGIAALPQIRAEGVEHVAALFRFRALEVLKSVDGLHIGKEFMEPLNAGLGSAVAGILDQLGKIVLAERAREDGIASQKRHFDLIVVDEKERLPFIFVAVLDDQLVVRVFGADKGGDFVKRREFGVFGKDARVIAHGFTSLVYFASELRCFNADNSPTRVTTKRVQIISTIARGMTSAAICRSGERDGVVPTGLLPESCPVDPTLKRGAKNRCASGRGTSRQTERERQMGEERQTEGWTGRFEGPRP